MNSILKLRQYGEIYQMKLVIKKAMKQSRSNEGYMRSADIVAQFDKEKAKIRKRIMKLFPSVKRWTNISTILSVPVAIYGMASGLHEGVVVGSIIAGSATMTKEWMKYYASKHQWIGFMNSNRTLNKQTKS